ncbi:MAG: 1-acyl-sn-glycerol-3-phosphate acyltransferase [Flavobacteriales bacterium]
MRVKNWTPTYTLGFILVWFTKRGYFSRVATNGLSNIPKNTPIIFAANHQNSLIDPIVIATSSREPIFFLTKSAVFRNPKIAKILYSLNMLPIYRERDGADFKERNIQIFNRCSELLGQNSRIIIFPEGSHNTQNRLRNLKKGIARIVMQAHKEHHKDIYIVPVGLNYTNTRNKSADLLVNYGEPINASELIENCNEMDSDTDIFGTMIETIGEGMKREMLDYSNIDYYFLSEFLISKVRRKRTTVKERFRWDKEKSEKLNSFIVKNQSLADDMQVKAKELDEICEENDLKPYLFAKNTHNVMLQAIGLILGFPFFLYGVLNSYIPSILPQIMVLKNIKDRQYDSSINMVLGGLLMFLFWSAQSLVVSLFTDNYLWMLYFISCVIFRWFSYEYHIFYLRFVGKRKYNSFVKENPQEAKSLREKYRSLKQFILHL